MRKKFDEGKSFDLNLKKAEKHLKPLTTWRGNIKSSVHVISKNECKISDVEKLQTTIPILVHEASSHKTLLPKREKKERKLSIFFVSHLSFLVRFSHSTQTQRLYNMHFFLLNALFVFDETLKGFWSDVNINDKAQRRKLSWSILQ